MRSLQFLRIIFAVVCVCSCAMAQNIVQNPGFETGTAAPWVVQGWGVTTGGAHTGSYYAETPCVGAGCIAPAPGSGAWLYQDLATTVGATYTLTFYYYPGPGTYGTELQVLWGASGTQLTTGGAGVCSGNCVFDNTSVNSTSYVQYTVNNLVATSATTRLEFLGRQDPSSDGLDDVVVQLTNAAPATPVPVPTLSTWAMGILAILLICGGAWSVKRYGYQH